MVRDRSAAGRAAPIPGYVLLLVGFVALVVGVVYPTAELLGSLTPSGVVSAGVAVDGRSLVVGAGVALAGSSSLVLGGLLVAARR